MIEQTAGGKNLLSRPNREPLTFLEDGNALVIRGWCDKPGGANIGFGERVGTVLPAR